MKHLRRLLVALVAFVAGVALTPIRFHVEGTGCGRMLDGGGGFSTTLYTSSYSVRLSFAHAGYVSTEKANEVFDENVRKAVRVVELTPKLDGDRTTAGRRAVAVFFDREVNEAYASVFWIDGKTVHYIHSPSLLHVIEFEKQNLGAWSTGASRIQYLLAPDTQ